MPEMPKKRAWRNATSSKPNTPNAHNIGVMNINDRLPGRASRHHPFALVSVKRRSLTIASFTYINKHFDNSMRKLINQL